MSPEELVHTIFTFLNGNKFFVGSLNLAALLQTGSGYVKALKNLEVERKKTLPVEELFWSIFLEAGKEGLEEAIQEDSNLDYFPWIRYQGTEAIRLKPDDLSNLFKKRVYHQKNVIRGYFDFLFSEIKGELNKRVEGALTEEQISHIVQRAKELAWDKWQAALRKALNEFPQLRNDELIQTFLHAVDQMEGKDLPDKLCVCDERFDKKLPKEYLVQTISQTGSESLFRAHSEENEVKWLENLKERLDNYPMFLTGPGGMGKTLFLRHLHWFIDQRLDKDNGEDAPFSGSILISLDRLMRENPSIHQELQNPMCPASESVLLRRIALLEGNEKRCDGWKRVFELKENEKRGVFERQNGPVLLMLDGFNEMRGLKGQNKDLYQRILREIHLLCDRESYPNIRMIVSSRAEREDELKVQSEELSGVEQGVSFQHWRLNGVELPPNLEEKLNGLTNIPDFLRRPMYYLAVKELETIPSTQFELLEVMYERLCKQGEANLYDEDYKICIRYIMKYFAPILAYKDWRNLPVKESQMADCYADYKQWPPLISSAENTKGEDTTSDLIKEKINHVKPAAIGEYLAQTMQLLCFEDGQYYFVHQDYRDYLAAKYFLQRKDYMLANPDFAMWNDEGVINSLSLNTYSSDIMNLLYQAVSFSSSDEANRFCEIFQSQGIPDEKSIQAGHILWYTTIYQLVDMAGIEKVSYGHGESLSEDALNLMEPLLIYLHNNQLCESDRERGKFNKQYYQNLIEIMMKCCELCRKTGQEDRGKDIIRDARDVLREQYGEKYDPMDSVVDYNEAKLVLNAYLREGQNDGSDDEYQRLRDALEKLRNSACSRPFRYACNTLGALLVSPHPRIKDHMAYLDFRKEFLAGGKTAEVEAFWLYYDAVFDERKTGEDWIPRLYSLRQLLYLLGDNKVELCFKDGDNKNKLINTMVSGLLRHAERDRISKPIRETRIPSEDNLRLIKAFLKKIESAKVGWKYYLQALVEWKLEKDERAARDLLQNLADDDLKGDARSALLLEFLNENIDNGQKCGRLSKVYHRLEPKTYSYGSEIGSYCAAAYYQRDIGQLYKELDRILK